MYVYAYLCTYNYTNTYRKLARAPEQAGETAEIFMKGEAEGKLTAGLISYPLPKKLLFALQSLSSFD